MYYSSPSDPSIQQGSEKRYLIKGEIPQSLFSSVPQNTYQQSEYKDNYQEMSSSPQKQGTGDLSLSVSQGPPQTIGTDEKTYPNDFLQAEKAYADNNMRIMRIKQLELENKIKLQAIENERLTHFLEEQTTQVQRLQEQIVQANSAYSEENARQADQIHQLLDQNNELSETVAALNNHLMRLSQEHQESNRELNEQALDDLRQSYENQIFQLKNQLNISDQQIEELSHINLQLKDNIYSIEKKLNIMIEENNQLAHRAEDQYEQNMQRENILKEQIKRQQFDMNNLKKRMENELVEQKRLYDTKLEEQRTEILRQMGEQVTKISAQVNDRDILLSQLREDFVKRESSLNEQNKQNQKAFQGQINEKQIEVNSLIRERELLQQEVNALKSQIELLEQQVVKNSKQLLQREQALNKERQIIQASQQRERETKSTFEDQLAKKEKENQSLKSKLEILLNDNETIILQVTSLEREIIGMKQQSQKVADDFDAQIIQIRSEIEQEKNYQIEQVNQDHKEALKRENKVKLSLEQKLKDAKEFRSSQDLQIKKLKENENLADLKISSLIESNQQYQSEKEKAIKEALNSKKDAELAQKRLSTVESNYQLELNTIQEQLRNLQNQDHKNEKDLQQQGQLIKSQSHTIKLQQQEINKLSNENQKLQSQVNDLSKSSEQLKAKTQNQTDIISGQKQKIYNLEHEISERLKTAVISYQEKEIEQQQYIDKITNDYEQLVVKYNEIVKKEKDNRFRLKLLKNSRLTECEEDIHFMTSPSKNYMSSTLKPYYNSSIGSPLALRQQQQTFKQRPGSTAGFRQ